MPAESILNSVPKLKGESNYVDWKFAMTLALRRLKKFDVVSGVTKKPKPTSTGFADWNTAAVDALTDIGLTIDPSQYVHIRACADGAEAWEALAAIYEKPSRANRIAIKRKLYGYIHQVDKPIQDYISAITTLAARLDAISCALTATDITDILIFNLDPTYSTIASTLAASTEELTVATVSGMLIDEERRKQGMEGNAERGGDAMYARYDAMYARHAPVRRGSMSCYRCGEPGHLAKDCTAPAPVHNAAVAFDGDSALTAVLNEDLFAF
jgi:hypothetical protein